MPYTQQQLEYIIHTSCTELFEQQPLLFSRQHDVNERTVSGQLSGIMSNHIENYHVNPEYNRMTDENGSQIPKRINLNPNAQNPSTVFPDIIIHRQEDSTHNLLIIEIKMSWKNGAKQADINKLNRYIGELNYQFGLYLELGENGIENMEWFNSDNEEEG
jgi:hypothetical protein